ncbi:MAG: CPBP family intramembrane metalloprotease [Lachnospiraceae bacterium]|nr:CPBP family intramembrane metalloprotease [Lachnospiraceae bacterium]
MEENTTVLSEKDLEKKRLWIFLALAYGLTAIMGIPMFIGARRGVDLTTLVSAQMFYPACGVILGKLFVKKEGEELPKAGYITILVTAALAIILGIWAFFAPVVEVQGNSVNMAYLVLNYVLTIGGIVAYILFWTCGKEKRANAGLSHNNIKLSVIMVAIFVVLYFLRNVIAGLLGTIGTDVTISAQDLFGALTTPQGWRVLLVVIVQFPLVFGAFFGEEYGWRYYLQPIMQKKFGLVKGTLLLGLVWALWHIFDDLFFYSVDTGFQRFGVQIVVCVSMAIFFAYAYMRTKNMWVPIIMHFLNNNLVAVFSGGDLSVMQNQVIAWMDILIFLGASIPFILFIFSPVFRKTEEEANA